MNEYKKIVLLAGVMTGTALSAVAQEKDSPISLSVSAGYEIDSNLTVDAIDNTSDVGDQAFVFDATAGYDFIDNDKVGLSAGYDFYMNKHQDLDAFDMTIHGFNLDSRYSLDRTDFGVTYLYNTINLGGDAFMDMHTFRPNVGYLFPGNKVYLIAAYEYQKQNFKQENLMGRDANRNSGSLKALFLLGEGRTISAGYTYSDHDTVQRVYSYTGNTFDISLKLPLEVFERETVVRTGYRLQSRGYARASLLLDDEIRSDKRHTFSASWEVPIINGFTGKAEYENIKSNSTYEPVDYDENIWTFSIGWEF